MVERMARVVGDTEYVKQCQAWLEEGTKAMEEDMWAGSYYLNFYEKETGKKSDDVMGYQLDGEWASVYHGLGGVVRPERAKLTLETRMLFSGDFSWKRSLISARSSWTLNFEVSMT